MQRDTHRMLAQGLERTIGQTHHGLFDLEAFAAKRSSNIGRTDGAEQAPVDPCLLEDRDEVAAEFFASRRGSCEPICFDLLISARRAANSAKAD